MRRNSAGKKRGNVGLIFLFLVFFGVFLYSGYQVLHIISERQTASSAYSELSALAQNAEIRPTVIPSSAEAAGNKKDTETIQTALKRLQGMDFSVLQETCTEITAWLRAEQVGINYPVVLHGDNDYYLNHMINGEVNINGAIFMDYRNSGDFSDRNTVIYGHRMKDGSMFGTLEKYKKQEFYEENPCIMLYTPEGDYRIEVFCGTVEDGFKEFLEFSFADEKEFSDYIESFRSRSLFESDLELQEGDRVVSLCTCSYEQSNARFLLMGRLVPLYE